MKTRTFWLMALVLLAVLSGPAAGAGREVEYRAADGTLLKGYLAGSSGSGGGKGAALISAGREAEAGRPR